MLVEVEQVLNAKLVVEGLNPRVGVLRNNVNMLEHGIYVS